MVLAGGCVDAAAPEVPPAAVKIVPHADQATASLAPANEICALAAQLPADNICSLMCEPEVMKEQLIADGMKAGTCYEFACTLPDSTSVSVGVCLPPPPP